MQKDLKHEVIHCGNLVSSEMKEDVIDLFFKSPYTEEGHYKNKAEYMKKELEFKYGRIWSIIIAQVNTNLSHSFMYSEDLLLEIKTNDYIVLAYLAPVGPPPSRISYQPPPLHQQQPPSMYSEVIRRQPIVDRGITLGRYESPRRYSLSPYQQRSYYAPPPPPPQHIYRPYHHENHFNNGTHHFGSRYTRSPYSNSPYSYSGNYRY